jgi:hypothetical protein|tara:strand:- start:698 stop:874 length:177 start_codon:yes stop_codon:yes gene_type:complete
MTVYHKIKCDTKTIYRSIKTGERYESEEAFLAVHPKEDLATDVEVMVPDLPMFTKTKK